MTTITHAEWVKAFEAAVKSRPDGDEGMTTREIADATGISYVAMGERMRMLSKSGALIVGHARRQTIDGRITTVPVYRPKV